MIEGRWWKLGISPLLGYFFLCLGFTICASLSQNSHVVKHHEKRETFYSTQNQEHLQKMLPSSFGLTSKETKSKFLLSLPLLMLADPPCHISPASLRARWGKSATQPNSQKHSWHIPRNAFYHFLPSEAAAMCVVIGDKTSQVFFFFFLTV